MKNIILIFVVLVLFFSGYFYFTGNNTLINKTEKMTNINTEEAYFAGGCFWCIEAIMDTQDGVIEAVSGYIGGTEVNPKYEEVVSGNTGHREGVKIIYNPEVIKYKELVEIFWRQIDPTDDGGQFADRGFQYTTAIYTVNEKQGQIANESKSYLDESGKFDTEVVTEILPFTTFYEAEEYHQDYAQNSSFRYNMYKKGSGRADYIEKTWTEEDFKADSRYKKYSEDELKNTKGKIVLFFHAEWCPTCKAFEKKVLSETIPDDITIFQVDFDSETELKKKYSVFTQSTFVQVDSEGNMLQRWVNARGIEDVIKKLNTQKNDDMTKRKLKNELTDLQYKVTQENGTERPFDNEYWDNHEAGIYVDVVDGTPLFSSLDKYDSGSGWPAFTRPIDESMIDEEVDTSLLMERTEVRSAKGDSHLGHVFNDGPKEEGGLRYCINSAALRFVPVEDLEKENYSEYLKLFQ